MTTIEPASHTGRQLLGIARCPVMSDCLDRGDLAPSVRGHRPLSMGRDRPRPPDRPLAYGAPAARAVGRSPRRGTHSVRQLQPVHSRADHPGGPGRPDPRRHHVGHARRRDHRPLRERLRQVHDRRRSLDRSDSSDTLLVVDQEEGTRADSGPTRAAWSRLRPNRNRALQVARRSRRCRCRSHMHRAASRADARVERRASDCRHRRTCEKGTRVLPTIRVDGRRPKMRARKSREICGFPAASERPRW